MKTNKYSYNLKIQLSIFVVFVICQISLGQQVNTSIDTTAIKIGEEIKLSLKVDANSSDQIIFPEQRLFGKLEVIESYKIDTTFNDAKISLIKKYGLTQFDSGKYTIPPLKVYINEKPFLSDSLLIEVNDVLVDTTKQKMYDIKPLVEVDKPKGKLNKTYIYYFLGLLALGLLVFWFIKNRKKKSDKKKEKELPPFEEAILKLTQLDSTDYLEKQEFKKYYTQLTDALKGFLDKEVYENALENTTDELIEKIQELRDLGDLPISNDSIQELRKVLQTSDLVKFAKSKPSEGTARADRNVIETLINETKDALPEPTEEELLKDEEYRLALELKEKKKKRKIIIASVLGSLLLIASIVIYKYGFQNVKDNVIGHPTKELLEGKWIRSEYGNPAVVITTPKVLKRMESNSQQSDTFAYGSLSGNFAVNVNTIRIPEMPSMMKEESSEESEEENKIDLDEVNQATINALEQQGASNIVLKQGEYDAPNGFEGTNAFGDFSLKNPITEKEEKIAYEIISFSQKNAIQQVIVFYKENDNYATKMVEKILDSIELKKEE